jgi:hypothetical protein
MTDFVATHILRVGAGRQCSRYLVRVIATMCEVDGQHYYNVIVSSRSKLYRRGTHIVSMVPGKRLTPIKHKEANGE